MLIFSDYTLTSAQKYKLFCKLIDKNADNKTMLSLGSKLPKHNVANGHVIICQERLRQ